MGRKKRVTKSDDDGTPLEIEETEDGDEASDPVVETEPPAEDVPEPNPQNAAVEGSEAVVWTKLGADRGAFSEHGTHAEGETVQTVHAEILIANGFAKRTGE